MFSLLCTRTTVSLHRWYVALEVKSFNVQYPTDKKKIVLIFVLSSTRFYYCLFIFSSFVCSLVVRRRLVSKNKKISNSRHRHSHFWHSYALLFSRSARFCVTFEKQQQQKIRIQQQRKIHSLRCGSCCCRRRRRQCTIILFSFSVRDRTEGKTKNKYFIIVYERARATQHRAIRSRPISATE